MTLDESKQVEELLLSWFEWQLGQSFADMRSRWYWPNDITCRKYQAEYPEDFDTLADEADARVKSAQAEQVQLCVDKLTVEMRAALQVSLRNKVIGVSVWSTGRAPTHHQTYQAAKDLLFPMLLLRGLVQATEKI